ncbi:hypothetical protein N1F78_02495 [Seonamhaeicola sp. MEBiC1930]|uniref:hypothetical protein n=1 Tax=Seonamhaeicola sp. MEBiC01930 TaxID=2976768 RepID=UPI00324E3B25
MKNSVIFFAVALFVSFSCNQSKAKIDKTAENNNLEPELSLRGTWERTSFYNYTDDVVSDTIHPDIEDRHIKIFTESKVMWCRFIPEDSTDWFGYGSYNVKNNTLTEILEYGCKSMRVHIANDSVFVFNLTLTKDTYSQVRVDDDGHPVFAENYVRVE